VLGRSLIFASVILLYASGVAATSESPIFWDELIVSSPDHGGVKVAASVDSESFLRSLRIIIREQLIEIPEECLPTGTPVLLNNLAVSYGEFSNGQSYWHVSFDVDEPESYDGVGKFHLTLLAGSIHSSYIEVRESERSIVDKEMCGFARDNG